MLSRNHRRLIREMGAVQAILLYHRLAVHVMSGRGGAYHEQAMREIRKAIGRQMR